MGAVIERSALRALAARGDARALVAGDRVLSYRELADRADACGHALGTVRRLVLLPMANDLGSVVALVGALAHGHAVLLTDRAGAAAMTGAYRPDVVLSGRGDGGWTLDERIDGTAHELHPDLALLLSTSGSTGSPKLVRLSAANLRANAASIAEYLELTSGDRAVTSLPLHYCYGLSVLTSHLSAGASVVVTDRSVVEPGFWDLVRRTGVTNLAGVPATFDLLDQIGFATADLPSLRFVTQAGGRMAPERVEAVARLGARKGFDLFVMYGQTEATARMAYLPPALAASHPAAVGVAIPGGELHIAEDGELVYRGPNVMLGYAETPADLALGRVVDELRTGDLARMDADGLVEIVGRRSRFVKLCGLRVDLDGVERSLAAAGHDALAAGDDDGIRVVTTGDAAAARQHVAASIGLPPSAVAAASVDALPRLANGKADLAAVTRIAGGTSERAVPGVLELYRDAFPGAAVRPDSTFVDLGGDSLSFIEVSLGLEQMLGHVPAGWPEMPIAQLRPAPARRRGQQVETALVLRGLSILFIVASHTRLVFLPAGAHILLGIAGFNLARFHLPTVTRTGSLRQLWRFVGRVALPTMALSALLVLTADGYGPANVLLLNNQAGDPALGVHWRFWYVEVLVQLLVATGALLTIPAVRRLESRRREAFALALVAAGIACRWGALAWVPFLQSHRMTQQPQTTLFLFAIGWAAAVATTRRSRLLLTAALAATLPGYFWTDVRPLLVGAGLAALIWLPTVRLPRPLPRALGALAGASLHVYLLHWFVYPDVRAATNPFVATVAALAVGLGAWWATTTGWRRLTSLRPTRARRPTVARSGPTPSP